MRVEAGDIQRNSLPDADPVVAISPISVRQGSARSTGFSASAESGRAWLQGMRAGNAVANPTTSLTVTERAPRELR